MEHTLSPEEPKIRSAPKTTLYTYVISTIAAVGGLLFGFDTGVISGAIPFITRHFHLNAHQEGFTVSVLIIGCVLGASFAGVISDRFGRKKILILSALFFTLTAVLSAIPQFHIELIIARFIGGLAVGAASVLSPMYISEIAPAPIRGRLVSFNQLTIVLGILLTYFTNWLLVDTGPDNWRWMFACGAIPAVAFFIALFFIPESPRWLAKRREPEKAFAVLSRIGGREYAKMEIENIFATLNQEKGSFSELLKPSLRKVLLAAVLLGFLSQVCGIDAVVYYAPKIFLRAGFESASSAFLASVCVPITLLIFTIVAVLYVDRLGRRSLLLVGLAGMALSFLLAGYAFRSETGNIVLLLISIIAYIAFFAMSVGPIPWIFISEVFPTKNRGLAVSIATLALWVSNFIVAQSFPWMIENIAGKSFYLFSGICVVTLVFVWLMITETKGKTLEEIERMWVKRV
jgi:MFS transporter, SP family, arabinose:H+ symporter